MTVEMHEVGQETSDWNTLEMHLAEVPDPLSSRQLSSGTSLAGVRDVSGMATLEDVFGGVPFFAIFRVNRD